MPYPREYVKELLLRVDIVALAREFVELKVRGSTSDEYVGLCPFHTEATPSFIAHSQKQMVHCFGCGLEMRAIHFLSELRGMTYVEAVRYLAKRHHFYYKQWKGKKRRQERKSK